MAIHHGYKINSTPGTAEPLMPARTLISWVSAWPRHVDDTDNTGEVRLGGPPLDADAGAIPSGSGAPLNPGDAAVVWPAHGVNPYDLNQIYMDVDQAEDGVQFVYHTT